MNEAMVSSSGTRRLATSRHASRAVSWREAMGRMLRLIAVPFRVELCGASLRQDSFLVLPPLRLLGSSQHHLRIARLSRKVVVGALGLHAALGYQNHAVALVQQGGGGGDQPGRKAGRTGRAQP